MTQILLKSGIEQNVSKKALNLSIIPKNTAFSKHIGTSGGVTSKKLLRVKWI
jgi:hypothetical protein